MAARLITRDDVIRAGACKPGVDKRIARLSHPPTALTADAALRLCCDDDEREYVKEAAGLVGHGHGYGCGDDTGDGIGDGHGYGYSYGNGYGSGDGAGYSHGEGYGYGYAYGDGYSHGYGNGECMEIDA